MSTASNESAGGVATTANDKPFLAEPPVPKYRYWPTVPKTQTANLKYRQDIEKRCYQDESYRRQVYEMCRLDSLFWLSTTCWLYEPRPKPHVMPFVPWDHQIPAWTDMERWLGVCDVGLEKSRGEGASWLIVMLCLHKWLFLPMFAAGIVSKDERSVDDPENPDSIFWKLDFNLKHMWDWMRPKFNRTLKTHMITNIDNGSTIAGYAAVGDVASGGRKTIFVMDELSKFPRGPDREAMNSTQYVTDCRYLISTPKGPEGAYFEAMNGKNVLKKIVLDWKQNPVRSKGAYKVLISTDDRRKIELVDLNYWQAAAKRQGNICDTKGELLRMAELVVAEQSNPFGYDFMMTGPYVKHDHIRSPWYDLQCRRPGATPAGIAQELDRDYGGSTSRFFDINMLTRLQGRCTPPVCCGEMRMPKRVDGYVDLQGVKFNAAHGGRLRLWLQPDIHNRIATQRNYVIGADVSSGTGGVATSNSALCVIDRHTGRQVAELASPQILPTDLAEYAVALCYWFAGPTGPAILIWEQNGSNGAQFGMRITQLGYANVYYRGQVEEYTERETKKIGFWTSNKTKPILLGELARALANGQLEVTSEECLEEAKFYVNLLGGKIEHISQSTEKDPSAAGERHGDRLIALALAWWVVKDYISDGKLAEAVVSDAPANSALGRRLASQRQESEQQAWVPPSQRRSSKTFRLWR